MKRITHWPQGLLGYGMNFGFVISWFLGTGEYRQSITLPVMIGLWCWTVAYGRNLMLELCAILIISQIPCMHVKTCEMTSKCVQSADTYKKSLTHSPLTIQIGVKSTAILFGSWVKPLVYGLMSIFVLSLYWAGVVNGQGLPYFAISVFGVGLDLLRHTAKLDCESPPSCFGKTATTQLALVDESFTGYFNYNGDLGLYIWLGIEVDYLLSHHIISM